MYLSQIQLNDMKKPKDSMHNHQCPTCGKGRLQLRKVNHRVKNQHINILVLGLWLEVCTRCGETLFGPVAGDEIERQILKKYPNYYNKKGK